MIVINSSVVSFPQFEVFLRKVTIKLPFMGIRRASQFALFVTVAYVIVNLQLWNCWD